MTISPVTTSVYAIPPTATYTNNTSQPATPSLTDSIAIGNLAAEGTTLNVTDEGVVSGAPTSTSFTLQQGDSLSLALAFSNIVDEASTQVQVFNSQGVAIADNRGTTAQQDAYTQLLSTGLQPGAGNYSVVVTPPPYTNAPAVTVNAAPQTGTSLSVNSELTASDPQEFYNFSFSSGNSLKLAFNTNSNTSALDIQVYDSNGNLIADNRGNSYLQQNYSQLTSATGLSAATGNYTVAVSYVPGTAGADQNTNYNFQLYSGTNYGVVDQTNVTANTATPTAATSVTATPDAQLYSRNAYNTVVETPASGVNIGWIQENKTSLNVSSLLTSFDSTDYYNFTLQTGNNLKFAFANTTNTADLDVQLLNATGTQVIADNNGTAAQQAAYAALTSPTGLTANPGQYVVKVNYARGASTTNQQAYNFQVFSGTSYSSVYQTTAAAQNYENALLSGDISGGYNAAGAAAAYLVGVANGSPPDIASALSSAAASSYLNASTAIAPNGINILATA